MATTVVILLVLVGAVGIHCDEHEFRLLKNLTQRYDVLERPVANHTESIVVRIGFVLQQIVEVDEKNQIIFLNAWIKYTWQDYKLTWNPEEYGGITDIRFKPTMIWKPDILVYNSADSTFDSTYHSNIIVYNDGSTLWIPPGIIKTTCAINIKWFPFDDQQCKIKFGSWTYNGNQLNLQPEDNETGVDTSEYLQNGEWLLLHSPVKRSRVIYKCCPEPYIDVKFYINIRRRTLYYMINLILPSILISLMTILGFTLPPDAGEKITLEITILLSVCIFLSYLANMIPQTSDSVPLLGTYFSCCMVVVSASVLSTVVVLNMHYRTPDTHEMGPNMRLLLLEWLPWLLMMQRPGHTFSEPDCLQPSKSDSRLRKEESESLMRNVRRVATSDQQEGFLKVPSLRIGAELAKMSPGAFIHRDSSQSSSSQESRSILETFLNDTKLTNRRLTTAVADHRKETMDMEYKTHAIVEPLLARPGSVDPGVQALIVMMQKIHAELRFMVKRMEKEDVDADLISDWKFAAMVIDRLCLIFYSLFMLVATIGIFCHAPNLFKA